LFFALLAKICVAIFVFLSAYGIAYTYQRQFPKRLPEKKELCSFVFRRYWKLMSAYWAAFALSVICQPFGRTMIDVYGKDLKASILYFIFDFFGVSYIFSTPTLNEAWWYMSLAQAIILLVPLLMMLEKKIGIVYPTVLLIVMMYFTRLVNPDIVYFVTMNLGVLCCVCNVFERYGKLWQDKRFGVLFKTLIAGAGFLIALSFRFSYNYFGLSDAFTAMFLALLVNTALIRIPVVTQVLQYLGKHSGNMFHVHNQMYSYYFLGFFYSFQNWFLILLVLTAASLLVSIVMEWLKRVIRYNEFMDKICNKITAGGPS
ncbi:MAG: acyltransferase family protein, partial [Blautia sp.]|nr:acyltransferase family protein [Blautia sp.]